MLDSRKLRTVPTGMTMTAHGWVPKVEVEALVRVETARLRKTEFPEV